MIVFAPNANGAFEPTTTPAEDVITAVAVASSTVGVTTKVVVPDGTVIPE